MDSYDGNGNLTGYTPTDGPPTTFSYAAYYPSGITFSTLTQQVVNPGQPTAQSSSFAYIVPMLGPASTTDAAGVKTTYQYDGFGRLQTILDNNDNPIKKYTYRYVTQP
jgi:YD repeat-containing protein